MKKSPIALAALLLALGTATISVMPTVAQAQTSEEQKKKEVTRPEWSKPYEEIQKLIGEKQYATAMEKVVKVLDATEQKTPYEEFFIARTKAVIASNTNDHANLAAAFDAMIKSEFLPMSDKLKFAEGMAGIFFNATKYKDAIVWANRHLDMDKTSEMSLQVLAFSHYFLKDYATALPELKKLLDVDLKAQKTPSVDRLRLLFSAQQMTKDVDGATATLELLVKFYPTKDSWADLIARVQSKPGFSERLRLDAYRILLLVDGMEEPDQYGEMAELALLAALPLEAKQVMEAGYKANMLGTGKNAAKHKPLLDKATKQATEDAKTLDAGEAAAKAAKTGLAMVNMGFNLVVNGQAERGIALMEMGVAKGGLKYPEEAKLHLGLAYLKVGNKPKAAEVFKSMQANDGSADLARYWLMVK